MATTEACHTGKAAGREQERPAPEQLTYPADQVARALSSSVRHIMLMEQTGRMPKGFKFGRKKLWRKSDIDLWLALGMPRVEDFERELKARQAAVG